MAARSKYLFVDRNAGAGDYNVIQSAINAAVAGGATSTATGGIWTVEVGPGVWTEDIDVPSGVTVDGAGMHSNGTQINGTATVHAGGAIRFLRVYPNGGVGWAIKCVLDANSQYPTLQDVKSFSQGVSSGMIKVIEITGTATGGYVVMKGCYLYANNAYTGDNSGGGAKAVIFHMLSDALVYVEARHGMTYKTSTGPSGTAHEYLIQNDVTNNSFSYVHACGDWESVYGGSGPRPVGTILKSLNTAHPGALLNINPINFQHGKVSVSIAYAGTNPYIYGMLAGYTISVGAFKRSGGVDYELSPVQALNHTPTGADVAPNGTVAFVT